MHTELLLNPALTPEVRTRAWRYCGDRLHEPQIGAHPGFELACARRGGLRYRIHARTFEVPVGMAMLVPPQQEHRTQMAPHSEATSLWLGHELVASVAELVRPEASRFEPRVVPAAPLAALGDVLLNEA